MERTDSMSTILLNESPRQSIESLSMNNKSITCLTIKLPKCLLLNNRCSIYCGCSLIIFE